MGLDAFNIAPDNKGGRKKKEEKDRIPQPSARVENALILERDNEDYWRELVVKHSDGNKPEGQSMAAICNEAQVMPRTVRWKLHEHGIFEYEHVQEEKLERQGIDADKVGGFAAFVTNGSD